MILVVDNDETARARIADALQDGGFGVIEADRAGPALETLEGNPAVELLVAAADLPVLGGAALAELAQRRRPNLRILLLFDDADHDHPGAANIARLRRPSHPTTIIAAVRALLNDDAPGIGGLCDGRSLEHAATRRR